eukprot:3934959-Rhodomonas_salina.2
MVLRPRNGTEAHWPTHAHVTRRGEGAAHTRRPWRWPFSSSPLACCGHALVFLLARSLSLPQYTMLITLPAPPTRPLSRIRALLAWRRRERCEQGRARSNAAAEALSEGQPVESRGGEHVTEEERGWSERGSSRGVWVVRAREPGSCTRGTEGAAARGEGRGGREGPGGPERREPQADSSLTPPNPTQETEIAGQFAPGM